MMTYELHAGTKNLSKIFFFQHLKYFDSSTFEIAIDGFSFKICSYRAIKFTVDSSQSINRYLLIDFWYWNWGPIHLFEILKYPPLVFRNLHFSVHYIWFLTCLSVLEFHALLHPSCNILRFFLLLEKLCGAALTRDIYHKFQVYYHERDTCTDDIHFHLLSTLSVSNEEDKWTQFTFVSSQNYSNV